MKLHRLVLSSLLATMGCSNMQGDARGIASSSSVESDCNTLDECKREPLIPAILALGNGQTIPQEALKENSSQDVGASLVERIHQKIESQDNEPAPEFDFWSNTSIQMAFSEAYISPISKECFLNQHQVNRVRPAGYMERRISTEDALASLSLGNANEVRPKYAFLGFKIQVPKFWGSNEMSGEHGNVIAVFKNKVKTRSTFTPKDSFLSQEIHSFYFRPLTLPPFRSPGQESGMDYWEVQIWGKACFSDVSHFIVNCFKDITKPDVNGNKVSGHISASGLAKLKATGIPIYECDPDSASSLGFREGNRIAY